MKTDVAWRSLPHDVVPAWSTGLDGAGGALGLMAALGGQPLLGSCRPSYLSCSYLCYLGLEGRKASPGYDL